MLFSQPSLLKAQMFEDALSMLPEQYSHLSNARLCDNPAQAINKVQVCADGLLTKDIGPYVLHHNKATPQVAVLFHGLSDSPVYFKAIAEYLHGQGYTVVVPMLPAHGLQEADEAMTDYELSARWQQHVVEMVDYAHSLGEQLIIGGFSTGGALATEYLLANNNQNVKGLMLFSGALALSDNVESLSKIWGIQWFVDVTSGYYETKGPNPYKYPSVSSVAAVELMEVINMVRVHLETGKQLDVPLFVAHSLADATTPARGVEELMAQNIGQNTALLIDESSEVCHADVVLSKSLVEFINADSSNVKMHEPCSYPQANKQFDKMIATLSLYLTQLEN